MSNKRVAVLVGFPVTVVLLIMNLAILSFTTKDTSAQARAFVSENNTTQLASSGTAAVLSANVIAGDAREPLLKKFLERKASPLAPYAATIVEEADKNKIDFRLVTSIAMCESNLGKHMYKKDSYNAWGISCYTGEEDKCTHFESWEQAIVRVSQILRDKYYNRGLTDIWDIGAIWAPPSVDNNYSWSHCVEKFMNQIQ